MLGMKPSQPIRLYRHPLSGHSHRAELLLSLLGLPYELVNVNLLSGEHKQPAFINKNSFGQVPVIEHRLDERMAGLCAAAETLVREAAEKDGLRHTIDYHEIFVASLNASEAVEHLRAALDAEGISHDEEELPMRASEDFGIFGHSSKSAMFYLGAGVGRPALHNPDYDFPDDLIAIGARIFMRTARNLLG